MNKTAIIYWSQTGNTEMMAEYIASGLKEKNREVDIYTISDFESDMINDYETLVFGCPAMGDEVLEETEFQPKFDELKMNLLDKKIGLFGSYDWGDGAWMRSWQEDCESVGLNVVCDPLIVHLTPDAQECIEYGYLLANQ